MFNEYKRCESGCKCECEIGCKKRVSATERLVGGEEGVVFFKRFMWCSFYILAMIFVIYLLS